jgi:cytochrome c oxidase accessory protein FixG
MSNLHLPILDQDDDDDDDRSSSGRRAPHGGSLGTDGHRKRPYPADVRGRWTRARRHVYGGLIVLWALLPWIPIGGHPAVFIDVDRRQFFLFGATFNAQDIWLLFFAVTGFGFGLVYLTTLLGRVWCGWACPQTVFVEAIFRPIERLVNGPRNVAMKRANRSFDLDRVWRVALTHILYALAALFVAHIFIAYFVSLPKLFAMVRAKPAAHPEVFVWMLAATSLFYVAFGIFREQFCVVLCPYGRLQSVLLDDDTLVIGYDERRGEPRGKAKAKTTTTAAATEQKGDCVDCNRCVVVCPTGIDIREGLQLDCIACTACIDACDDVMVRLERPRGLVRYDSLRGLRGEQRRILRPRVWIYTALLVIGIVVATLAVRKHEPFEANILRLPGTPYTRENGKLRNGFEIHIVNKTSKPARFLVTPEPLEGLEVIAPMSTVEIEPLGNRRVPFFVTMDESKQHGGGAGAGAGAAGAGNNPLTVTVHITADDGTTTSSKATKDVTAKFLGAGGGGGAPAASTGGSVPR